MIDLPVIQTGLELGTINIKTQEISVHATNTIWFECTSRVDCCSKMRIPASTFDIQRIMDHGYELDQIVGEASPVLINPRNPNNPKEKAYFLKQKPFDGTCTFLENELCKIHEFKPFACRVYPFALDFIDEDHIRVVIHQDQLCKSIKATTTSGSNNESILLGLVKTIRAELLDRNIAP